MNIITVDVMMCIVCRWFLTDGVVCLFFFKRKTAYEWRISDWSSDVCSSDLHQRRLAICCGLQEGERWERHGYAAEADSYWLGFPTGLCTIAFVYAEACKPMSFREFGKAFCSFEPVCTDIFE